MRSEDKASLLLAGVFLVLLLSVVWASNWQYETKLKVSLVMAVPVLVAVSVILTLQRWMRKTLLAYSSGLKMRANNMRSILMHTSESCNMRSEYWGVLY